jgi:hypothetical protein
MDWSRFAPNPRKIVLSRDQIRVGKRKVQALVAKTSGRAYRRQVTNDQLLGAIEIAMDEPDGPMAEALRAEPHPIDVRALEIR